MRRFALFTLLAALTAAPPAMAGTTLLQLNETVEVQLDTDLIFVRLDVLGQAKTPAAAQAAVNAAMTKAVSKAKAVSDVKLSTGSYHVYAQNLDNGTPRAGKPAQQEWFATQTLLLTSGNTTAALDLAGTLQEAGLVMRDMSFAVSPERLSLARDDLISQGLVLLQSRADKAAKTLKGRVKELRQVAVDPLDAGPRPMPMMKTMAMAADFAPPVGAPGEQNVLLRLTADVVIETPEPKAD